MNSEALVIEEELAEVCDIARGVGKYFCEIQTAYLSTPEETASYIPVVNGGALRCVLISGTSTVRSRPLQQVAQVQKNHWDFGYIKKERSSKR